MKFWTELINNVTISFEERSARLEAKQLPDMFLLQIVLGTVISSLFGVASGLFEPMTLRHATAKFGAWFPNYLNMFIFLWILGKGVDSFRTNIVGWLFLQACLVPLVFLTMKLTNVDATDYMTFVIAFIVVFIDAFLISLAYLTISEFSFTVTVKKRICLFTNVLSVTGLVMGIALFDLPAGRLASFTILILSAVMFAVRLAIIVYDKVYEVQFSKISQ